LRDLIALDADAKVLFQEVEKDAGILIGAEPTPLLKIRYEGLVNTDHRPIFATLSRM